MEVIAWRRPARLTGKVRRAIVWTSARPRQPSSVQRLPVGLLHAVARVPRRCVHLSRVRRAFGIGGAKRLSVGAHAHACFARCAAT